MQKTLHLLSLCSVFSMYSDSDSGSATSYSDQVFINYKHL